MISQQPVLCGLASNSENAHQGNGSSREICPGRLPASRRAKLVLQQAAARILQRHFGAPLDSRVVVLCYHSVHPTKPFATHPALFEQHLRWLEASCNNVKFSEALTAVWRKERERPAVAITFDDGYLDNFEYAFPLLQQYRLEATFFVTTGLIENNSEIINRFQLIRRSVFEDICPMTWSQLRQMASLGMEIGAHTYSHAKLAALTRRQVWMELTTSKWIMEDRLGRSVQVMAYPYGKPLRHWNHETVQLTAEAGYKCAGAVLFRNVQDRDLSLAIPRIVIGNDSVRMLSEKVYGYWDLVGLWQERFPMWLAHMVTPRDFRAVPGFDAAFSEIGGSFEQTYRWS